MDVHAPIPIHIYRPMYELPLNAVYVLFRVDRARFKVALACIDRTAHDAVENA